MCCIVHYMYRCGCDHTTVYQCPRVTEANQRLSPEYRLHGCSRSTTHLDEPCQDCEGDEEQASEADGEGFLPAESDHDLENVDPNHVDDAEPGPASDGGLDVASGESSFPERRGGRRVLGEITPERQAMPASLEQAPHPWMHM